MSRGLQRRKEWGGLWWLVLWGLRRGARLSESRRIFWGTVFFRGLGELEADGFVRWMCYQRRNEIGDGKELLIASSECDDLQAVIGIRTGR